MKRILRGFDRILIRLNTINTVGCQPYFISLALATLRLVAGAELDLRLAQEELDELARRGHGLLEVEPDVGEVLEAYMGTM